MRYRRKDKDLYRGIAKDRKTGLFRHGQFIVEAYLLSAPAHVKGLSAGLHPDSVVMLGTATVRAEALPPPRFQQEQAGAVRALLEALGFESREETRGSEV